ncbi:MAG: hypothetical protein DHS20C11_04410 [Lysobacteraceae bacterium]|nr:MAG: hypothetical protein DHS20C11_04410 [Xanthomonadaceae bacterium]
MSQGLNKDRITQLLHMLDHELGTQGSTGELHLVGGAVMCLVFDARPATKDLDALFRPTAEIREAAGRIAEAENLPADWLNDAVKGFLSNNAEWSPYLDLPNLKVFVARPEYLLALKSAAMRIGEGYSDIDDVRFLLRYLNISQFDHALTVIGRYLDPHRIPQKTLYALEELLPQTST